MNNTFELITIDKMKRSIITNDAIYKAKREKYKRELMKL